MINMDAVNCRMPTWYPKSITVKFQRIEQKVLDKFRIHMPPPFYPTELNNKTLFYVPRKRAKLFCTTLFKTDNILSCL